MQQIDRVQNEHLFSGVISMFFNGLFMLICCLLNINNCVVCYIKPNVESSPVLFISKLPPGRGLANNFKLLRKFLLALLVGFKVMASL